jgi:hypothetical protein
MNKLSKAEIKILTWLDKHVDNIVDQNKAYKELVSVLGFSYSQATKFYNLWYLNQDENIPYKELTDIKRDSELVIQYLEEISKSNNPEEKVDELYDKNKKEFLKFMGPWWNLRCGGWASTSPCIRWKSNEVTLVLDTYHWEKYFSGLDEDSIWRYNDATSHYSENNEDFDDDEFNYVLYDDETLKKLKSLGEMGGIITFPGSNDSNIQDGDIALFLERVLTPAEYQELKDNYVWELGSQVSTTRNNEIIKIYDDEITYPSEYCSGGDNCLKIPYKDLINFVKDSECMNLSEIKDEEINGIISLDSSYYDVWLDKDGKEQVINEFNFELDRVIDHLLESDDTLPHRIEKIKNFNSLLKKLNFRQWKNEGKYASEDGKIVIFAQDYNSETNKIMFTYNGENHITPLEELVHWVQGSILDLNESVRIGKYRLMMETIEQPENITKIAIFDFDGTLMNTPSSKNGKIEWEEKTGKKYPHIGWWSKRESLDTNIFDIKPIKNTIIEYLAEYEDPHTLVIMLTGRLPNQADQVEGILNSQGIIFDEYHYKDKGDTLTSKFTTIRSLLNRYPNVNFIEIYEDREPHVIEFDRWGEENNIDIKVNLVKENATHHF